MKITRGVLFTTLLLCMVFSGCTRSVQESEDVSAQELEEAGEYALWIDGIAYEIHQELPDNDLFTEEEMRELQEEFPFPAGRQYSKDELFMSTFLSEGETSPKEALYYICTAKEGKTPREIRVGDSLKELCKAYPELIYCNGAAGSGTEMAEYTRLYLFFIPDDGTNNYIHFYVKNDKVVMIETADGLDTPREWYVQKAILGDDNIFKEVLSDKPGQTHIRYFSMDEDGTEKTVLDIPHMTEEYDIDEDGIDEIIVYLAREKRALGIYDRVNGEISYLDVNEELGSSWSEYMGNIGNVDASYTGCIEAAFEQPDGTCRYEVYKVKDNILTYVCTFDEALRR